MLTTTRAVLLAPDIDDVVSNYEAIVVAHRPEDLNRIWKNNKTPVMARKDFSSYLYKQCTVEKLFKIIEVDVSTPSEFITLCHVNGIECGEVKTKEKINTKDEHCFLCDIGTHKGFDDMTTYNAYTESYTDMVIYESENFYVTIELGALKPGMLMICPKEHYLSAAQIPLELIGEYEQVKRDVEFILKGTFGDEPVLFFEHGSAPDGISSHKRSVVHAHTHVAWGVKFEQKFLDMVSVRPVRNIKDLAATKYFSYQEGTKGKLLAVWDPEVYVQRQYPRQVIAFMEGIPNEKSNWRIEPFHDNMKLTFKVIYEFLAQNREFLCDRIVDRTTCYVEGYPLRKL